MSEYYKQGRKIARMSISNGWATPAGLARVAEAELEDTRDSYLGREFALGALDEATLALEQEENNGHKP